MAGRILSIDEETIQWVLSYETTGGSKRIEICQTVSQASFGKGAGAPLC